MTSLSKLLPCQTKTMKGNLVSIVTILHKGIYFEVLVVVFLGMPISLKCNVLIFCQFIALKIEKVAPDNMNESMTSPSLASGNGYDTDMLIKASERVEAEAALQKITKKRLIIDDDDSDTSGVDSNDSNLLVNNLVGSLVSNSVSKDVIEGMIIF